MLARETLGCAIVVTGCPRTVAGDEWFKSYVSTLSRKDGLSIRTKHSTNRFCFGNGKTYISMRCVTIPIYVSQHKHQLRVDIVNCSIPLLLSRESLRRAKAKVDIELATISFLGDIVPLIISSSGHICLSICRSLDPSNDETRKELSRVLFSSPIGGVGLDLKNKAHKLHLQFCHPSAERLIGLVKEFGTSDQCVFDVINEITSKCDVCFNKKPPLKPAVGDRKTFIKQAAKRHNHRVLNHKSRTHSTNTFCQGDLIYYWRKNDSEYRHGPAVVIGRDGQQIRVKHGDMYIRVRPCRLQLCPKQNLPPDVIKKGNAESAYSGVLSSSESDCEDYSTADEGKDTAAIETNTVETVPSVSLPDTTVQQVGKSTAEYRRYINIKEGGGKGKCGSFQNAKWSLISDEDSEQDGQLAFEPVPNNVEKVTKRWVYYKDKRR